MDNFIPDTLFKKLPLDIQDFNSIRQDAIKLKEQSEWISHVNTNDFEGNWQVLPLRGLASNRDAHPILQAMQISADTPEEYINYSVIKHIPGAALLLQQLHCGVLSVRLMSLEAGAEIKEHRDHGLCFSAGQVRLHLCLTSNDKVQFTVGGKTVPIKEGELWYINADEPHAVINNSDTSRIHLVIDCLSNDWLQIQIGLPVAPDITGFDLQERREWLSDFAASMIDHPSLYPDLIRRKVHSFASGLADHLGLELQPSIYVNDAYTSTSKGKAISLFSAAKCAEEHLRTARFLQGIHLAISEKFKKRKTVSILYAGTGPFATLLLPLLPLLDQERVNITFLDIHQESLDSLQSLLELFGLNSNSHRFVCADACEWQSSDTFDVIISETMKAALAEECQVSVFQNLVHALREDGVLIPERVSMEAFSINKNHQLNRLGEISQLCLDSVQKLAKGNLTALNNEFPIDPDKPVTAILIETHIQVYDDIKLGKLECSLNAPVTIKRKSVTPLKAIGLEYRFGEKPGYQLVEHE